MKMKMWLQKQWKRWYRWYSSLPMRFFVIDENGEAVPKPGTNRARLVLVIVMVLLMISSINDLWNGTTRNWQWFVIFDLPTDIVIFCTCFPSAYNKYVGFNFKWAMAALWTILMVGIFIYVFHYRYDAYVLKTFFASIPFFLIGLATMIMLWFDYDKERFRNKYNQM